MKNRLFLLFLSIASTATWLQGSITPLWQSAGHGTRINALAVSPDASMVATASDDQTVKLWSAADGALLHTFSDTRWQATSVTFSADGAILACGDYEGRLRLYNTTTFSPLLPTITASGGRLVCLAFSSDGQYIASGSGYPEVRIHQLSNGGRYATLTADAAPTSIFFTGSNAFLVSTWQDGKMRVWDVVKKSTVKTIADATGALFAGALSTDGQWLATGGVEALVRIYATADWALAQTFTMADPAAIRALAFSKDGTIIAVAQENGSVTMLGTGDGSATGSLPSPTPTTALVEGSNGQWLLAGLDGSLCRQAGGTAEPLWRHAPLSSLTALSPNGRWLASASPDGSVDLINARSGAPLQHLAGHPARVTALTYSADGQFLATGGGCGDGSVRVWRTADGQQVFNFAGVDSGVSGLAFSPDSATLISADASPSPNIRWWSLQTGQSTRVTTSETAGHPQLRFTNDGNQLLAVGGLGDHRLHRWEAGTGQAVGTAPVIPFDCYGASVSPDGQRVAWIQDSYNPDTEETTTAVTIHPASDLASSITLDNPAAEPLATCFDADGRVLHTASATALQCWDAATGAPLATLDLAGPPPAGLSVSSNGNYLAWTSRDGTVSVTDNPVSPLRRFFSSPGTLPEIDGWYWVDWMQNYGAVAGDYYPWIYHWPLGWMYCYGAGGETVWMWHGDARLGWLWTGPAIYPMFYASGSAAWVSHAPEDTDIKRFMDLGTQTAFVIP